MANNFDQCCLFDIFYDFPERSALKRYSASKNRLPHVEIDSCCIIDRKQRERLLFDLHDLQYTYAICALGNTMIRLPCGVECIAECTINNSEKYIQLVNSRFYFFPKYNKRHDACMYKKYVIYEQQILR